MEPEEDRPKWSITWLLRIQRVGRRRQDIVVDPEGKPLREPVIRRWAFIIVAFLFLVEIAVGVWLGLLPR